MKTRLVDFDVEKAQKGAKVATRVGERARIVCYNRIDNTDVKYPIVALVMGKITKCECAQYYTIKGEWNGYRKSCNDLMIEEPEFEYGDIIAFGCEEDNPIIGIFKAIPAIAESFANFDSEALEQAEIQTKYETYLQKEQELVKKMSLLENLQIPSNFDYEKLVSLSAEARQKFKKIQPQTLGQASRISGVNPSDVQILMVFMGR